jgi:hypothetical protein
MAFYVCHAEFSRDLFIMGYSAETPEDRRKSYETGGGRVRMCALATGPDSGRELETAVFAHLRKYRVRRGSEESGRDFELFRAAPYVRQFIGSARARALGIVTLSRPFPEYESATQWLIRCRRCGCEAAAFALSEQARLRQHVPRSARGGWPLVELLSGAVHRSRQLALGEWGIESEGHTLSKKHGWAMHRITYRGTPYLFPIFAEVCRRQLAFPVPDGAVETGLRFWCTPPEPSGRKGMPLRNIAPAPPVCEEQLPLAAGGRR